LPIIARVEISMGVDVEANKAVVARFLTAVAEYDLEAVSDCLSENVVQHYQQPTNQADEGSQSASALNGRKKILHEIGTYFPTLYRLDTVKLNIQTIVGEGEYVAARFTLQAITAGRGEPYENYYFFLYRVLDAKVVEYWEYCDTKYAAAKLF
jgi:ketosteroid isomerase-like protein